MVNKEHAVKIARQFIKEVLPDEDWYKTTEPSVKAILLYGSVTKGTNRDDSDIDILVILPLKVEEKYTTGEYFYDYQKQKINVVLRSIERLRDTAKKHKDKAEKEVFKDSVIIESDKETKALLGQISSI